MEEIDYAMPASTKGTDDKDLLKIFVNAYYQSNQKFPQTRYYFVIDLASRAHAGQLLSLLAEEIVVPQNTIRALAKSASVRHTEHRIPKSLTSEMIRSDIHKMFEALSETYDRYARLTKRRDCHTEFIFDCTHLKREIDARRISRGYLNFVSPEELRETDATAVVRTTNSFLSDHVLSLSKTSPILVTALEKEITRPLWVVRPTGVSSWKYRLSICCRSDQCICPSL